MPKCEKLAILPFHVKELFNVVMDIESYPQFLPWCVSTKIIEKHENYLIADMYIGYQSFSGKYRSKVEFKINDPDDAYIYVSLINGPFKYLYNNWKFKKLSNNETEIRFDIDFTFKSVIFGKMIKFIFDNAFNKIMKSFENRVYFLYK